MMGLRGLIGALWLAVIAGMAGGAVVHAHGGGTPRLTAVPVGPYSVFAWTEPEPWRAGEVHVTVAVTTPPPEDADINNDVVNNMLEQPVDDARVTVTFVANDGTDAIVMPAQPGTLNAFYLETDTKLPHDGAWTVQLDVTGPAGGGVATFDVDVLPAQRLSRPMIVVATVGFFALLAVIGLRARRSAPSGRAMREVSTELR